MKFKQNLVHFAVLLVLSFLNHHVYAEPKLNGMATHSELGSEQFIAAVFSDTPTSSSRQLLLSNENKAMEIRVLAEKLYSRRFKRMWVEGIAINAGAADLEKHSQDLSDFTGILRIKLKRGDILRVERVMAEGTIISLNDFILGTINNTRFFDLLLRTWIGPVPLSSDFKQGLLGNGHIPTQTLKRFETIAPTPARLSALSQALIAEREAQSDPTEVALQTPPNSDATPPESAEESPDTVVTNDSALSTESPDKPSDTKSQEPTIAAEASLDTESSTVETSTPMGPKTTDTTLPSDTEEQVITAVIPLEDEGIFDDEEEQGEEDFSADSLLSQQIYISKLTKWTSQFVKYPRQALRKNHEGSVRLRVELTRNGRVKSVEPTAESKYSSLNKAALKAVKSASPYPRIPEEIKGETFSFTVPVVFRLN